ncbi:protein YbgI [Enterobacter cancerogenus]|uniref:Protein YbgI n=1 Tax=Enterobacter cancerogenus TaxID=69218 RepID=A0A484X0C4_9ENTR|nr:protein YbgI [Enterobacter cancerogenus]
MNNHELERLINEKLNTAAFSDYGPNGLQVEGRDKVQKNYHRRDGKPGAAG